MHLQATFDFRLVALSVIIAICASYAALDLVERITVAGSSSRLGWLTSGAIAMGTGIWSMHFTGMLAYHLPVEVYYHIPTVLLSLLLAIVASFIALFVVCRPRIGVLHVIAGTVLIAAGICGMHYTGMDAMRLAAMHHWDQGIVLLSILIALVVALAALGMASLFRTDGRDDGLKAICATLMGFAICSMHYTAMAAVSYTAMTEMPDRTNSMSISAVANTAIVAVTFVVLGSVFLFQRWFPVQEPARSEA
ncbi:MAG TPA: MHYT domain-containing protein [Candidatus Angelobacter sp.]|nr:MHYT domain-containing protein [Candidatus Angelobacter sp.]